MKRLMMSLSVIVFLGWSSLGSATSPDAVQVLNAKESIEAGAPDSHATVTLRIRDLGPEKDVGILLTTVSGEAYRPGVYYGIADEYGYEIWKVETTLPVDTSVQFLGVHRVGGSIFIDDNEGAYYSLHQALPEAAELEAE